MEKASEMATGRLGPRAMETAGGRIVRPLTEYAKFREGSSCLAGVETGCGSDHLEV